MSVIVKLTKAEADHLARQLSGSYLYRGKTLCKIQLKIAAAIQQQKVTAGEETHG